MLEIEVLHEFETEFSADSVEWCHQDSFKNCFAVGTYQLEEKNADDSSRNTRKGKIYLFEYDEADNKLTKLQEISTDAILDQKWMINSTAVNLVTATSLGRIQVYKLDDSRYLCKQKEISLSDLLDNLTLSIDVNSNYSKVLASDSKGQISLLDLLSEQSIVKQWKAHDFEAWTCAFDPFNKSTVFSGGDDSTFKIWDLRVDYTNDKPRTVRRDAGVTSFLVYSENIIFVGSYDERLCSYDTRNLKHSTDEINLKGGVWRIKQSPNNRQNLLLACMYHNFSIVDCSSNFRLIGEYFGHDSICYGCDWAPPKTDYEIFASCSFYDHKLSVCKVK